MVPHKISPPSTPNLPKPVITPSLPHSNSSLSYWHKTTRAFKHLHANATNPIPTSTKFAIIGSGLSGALTAYSLISHGIAAHDILILEAREAASGASGRNAGHVRPDAFRGFAGYAALHGPEQALKIIANEKLVFERLGEFVKTHDVPCDFHATTTFDVCLTEEFARYEADSFRAFRDAGGDVAHVRVYEGAEAVERTRVPGAVAAYEWPAGSSHPAKLTQWLLTEVVEMGVGLYTHAPVVEVTKGDASWIVETSRGTTKATKVVYCTNAYTAALLPQLAAFITPNRAQAHSVIPGPAFSGDGVLASTMSLRYSMQHFYSLIQRQGDGTFILGVSRHNPTLSRDTKAQIESFDDSAFHQEIVDDALRQFKVLFPDSGHQDRHGEGLDHAWTGVIGMTPDSVPLVGPIDGLEGQYICAGFNGHGMARIFTCAPGLAKLILGGSWEDTGLPECFQYSADRLSKAEHKAKKPSVW